MTWVAVLLATVGTLAARVPIAALTDSWQPPRWLATRLAALTPAAVGALLVMTTTGVGTSTRLASSQEMVAVVVAAVVMRRTRVLALALLAGVGTVVILP